MLHGFRRGSRLRWRECIQRYLHPRFHGLRFCVLRRLNAEGIRARNLRGIAPKEVYRSCNRARLDHQCGKTVQPLYDFRELAQDGVKFFYSSVNRSRVFKCQPTRRAFALGRKLALQRVSGGIKISLNPIHFGHIFVIAAALEARSQAHFHFGINASGEFWVGMQIVDAAPHLEEVERIVHELLGGNPRNEGAVIERTPAQPAYPRRNRSSRGFVFEMPLHKRREAESQPLLISLGENGAQDAVEQKPRLEVRTRGSVLDPTHAIARVELFGPFFHWPEQPLQATSEIGCLGYIRFGLGVRSPQKKDRRGGGNRRKDFRISLRREFQTLSQHEFILLGTNPEDTGDTDVWTFVRPGWGIATLVTESWRCGISGGSRFHPA